ncbi:unnamed protein product [Didymodactylos carnosus]|uniref:Uncharacterized protein n=1 Tax=Didymodactylos carnosus TaxID=1234261 RepID=A0A815C7F8_9BILA|nr:unnamed protein product [Didymodactylos carnosus]CAF1283338.1 unnamed protein product [Didymodactylos carnosus]CAF3995074.1 unnamed protein product [Didymodactylos carnosus]CAF4080667.1 unnamed protein product [Didymodactylos carnosus]
MTYQQVQYKDRIKNVPITVIDNQEFVLLKDVQDEKLVSNKISAKNANNSLLLNDNNPIKYEMDEKGNQILPLRIKASSNDILTGDSPDDSDTKANDQRIVTTVLGGMIARPMDTLKGLLKYFVMAIAMVIYALRSTFFPSTLVVPITKEPGLLDDINELKKVNVEYREREKCLDVERALSAPEMKLFCNVVEKGYEDVRAITFQNSMGENRETIKIFSETLKASAGIFTLTFKSQLRDDEIESIVVILKENEILEGVIMYGGISDETAELMANALINKKTVKLILDAGQVSFMDDKATTKNKLSLIQNKISDRGAKALAGFLQGNEKLDTFSLALNEISSDGTKYIAQALSLNQHLLFLSLSDNKISDAGAIAIAEALKINKKLTSLDVRGNQIGDSGAKALFDMLSQSTTVQVLYLERNKITDASAKHIENVLCENKTLVIFSISDNEISESVYNEMHKKVSKVNKHLSW